MAVGTLKLVYSPPKDKKEEKPIVLMLSAAKLHLCEAEHVIAGVDVFTVLMEDNPIAIYKTCSTRVRGNNFSFNQSY